MLQLLPQQHMFEEVEDERNPDNSLVSELGEGGEMEGGREGGRCTSNWVRK